MRPHRLGRGTVSEAASSGALASGSASALLAGVPGGLTLVLALAAASPSAPGGAAAGPRVAGRARAVAPGGSWGTAEEVPGTAALNKGGDAGLNSVSCAKAGSCSAGGIYADASGHSQVFAAGEVRGIWGKAEEVPGTAALNKGGGAELRSVSCARAGNCSAGGYYTDAAGRGQAFAAGEVRGIWGKAQEVPGTAALNKGGDAEIRSVSCARAGNCSAGGSYLDASLHPQAFVVNET